MSELFLFVKHTILKIIKVNKSIFRLGTELCSFFHKLVMYYKKMIKFEVSIYKISAKSCKNIFLVASRDSIISAQKSHRFCLGIGEAKAKDRGGKETKRKEERDSRFER